VTEAESVASHEAAHAVAAVLLGISVTLIDVAGDATALRRVLYGLKQPRTRDDAVRRMMVILAGPLLGGDIGIRSPAGRSRPIALRTRPTWPTWPTGWGPTPATTGTC
jgi:hypothetical protein